MISPYCIDCEGAHDQEKHNRKRHLDYSRKLERDGKMFAAIEDIHSAIFDGFSPALQHLVLSGATSEEVDAMLARAIVAVGPHEELKAGIERARNPPAPEPEPS